MPKSVRRPASRVPKRNRSRPTAPESISYPGATYWFAITLLGYTVKVFRIRAFETDGQVGAYDQETHEIYVKEGLSEQEDADTLLHEVVHAVSRIALPPDLRLTENQVTILSTVLADTFTRNPKLRENLLARLGEPVS